MCVDFFTIRRGFRQCFVFKFIPRSVDSEIVGNFSGESDCMGKTFILLHGGNSGLADMITRGRGSGNVIAVEQQGFIDNVGSRGFQSTESEDNAGSRCFNSQ